MTEKELGIFICECVNGLPDSGDNGADCMTLAKALTQRYPQISAEKVWEGMVCDINAFRYLNNGKNETEIIYTTRPSPISSFANQKNIQVFIREVVS